MKKEIIPIQFKEGQYKTYDENLKQWNHSQQLAISGLDISDEIVEVHFSLQEAGGTAKRMLGTVTDGIIHVKIPVFVLEGPEWSNDYYSAWAWIYLSDEESAETVRKIEFTIEARPKPDEYVTPEELSFLQQLEVAMQNKLDKSGHFPNKFIGTDEKGNIVTKEQEEFSLEIATEEKLGGVKPLNKTDDMTLEVGVDKDGRLFAKGKDIKVDSDLDEKSQNPVQNAVVTKEVNELKKRNAELEETVEKLAIKQTTDKATFHHITDSANCRVLDFGMEGKTEQNTVAGNQLFDKDSISLLNELLQNDGSAFPNPNYVHTDFIEVVHNDVYSINVFSDTYLFSGLWFYDENKVFVSKFGSSINILIPENAKYMMVGFTKKVYSVFTEAEMAELLNCIMLVKGSTKPTTYEPYTNGPSPNPDYPQEIVNAGVYNEATGRYEIGCCVGNKNLIVNEAISTNQSGINFTVNEDGSISVKGTNTLTYSNVFYLTKKMLIKAGEYVISGGDPKKDAVTIHVLDTYRYIYSNQTGNDSMTFTFGEDTYVEIFIQIIAGVTVDDIIYPMLRVKGDDSTFAPLVSKKFTLTSPVPLTKWDYLTKRDGVYGWSVWSLHLTVDEKSWNLYSNNGFMKRVLPTKCMRKVGYCNQLTVNTELGKIANGLWLGVDNDSIYAINNSFRDLFLEDGGLANWKAHLKENPLEIITYADEEQSFHPLPDSEQTLLNNLETYYGVTNAYNDQGCPMWLEYVADTKLYVDNQLLAIKEAMI